MEKKRGEILTDESVLFKNYENPNRKNEYLSDNSMRQILDFIFKRAVIERKKTKNRYDKIIIYGFRKRFNTILKLENDVNSNISEKLMGHKKGPDGAYLKPTREQCFAEFVKAIPQLTIDPTERLRAKNSSLEQQLTKYQTQGSDIEKLKKQCEYDHILVAQFAKVLKHFHIDISQIDGSHYEIQDHEIDSFVQNNFPQLLEQKIKDNPELALIGE